MGGGERLPPSSALHSVLSSVGLVSSCMSEHGAQLLPQDGEAAIGETNPAEGHHPRRLRQEPDRIRSNRQTAEIHRWVARCLVC